MGEKFAPEVVIDHGPLFAQGRIAQDLAGLLDNFIGHKHGHFDGLKAQRVDVAGIDGVGVDHHGFAKVDGFEKGVAKALVITWISHQVGVGVDVEEGVDFLAEFIHPPELADAVSDKQGVDPGVGDAVVEELYISVPLITTGMGENEFEARLLQAAQEFDGMLDAFPGHQPGRLQNKDVIFRDSNLPAEVGGIFVHRRRRRLKIDHIRNHGGGLPVAACDLLLLQAVDHDMLKMGQRGRKGCRQIIRARRDGEPFALPGKVVMVRNGGNPRLCDHLGDGQSEWDMHRNGENILRDEHLEIKPRDEGVEGVLETFLELMHTGGDFARAGGLAKKLRLHFQHFRVIKKGALVEVANLRGAVEQSRHPVAGGPLGFEDGGPLGGFQRDAIRAMEAGGDEADALGEPGERDRKTHKIWRAEICVKGCSVKTSICEHLAFLYGESVAPTLADAVQRLINAARAQISPGQTMLQRPGARDCMLITYGDQVRTEGEPALQTLHRFLAENAGDGITAVHLLPFYPSSSDDGFSVQDYYAVDPAIGGWDDIATLAARYPLMFDAVFNHASAQGIWFGKFLAQEPSWETAFFTVEGDPDLSAVVRPRALPLLTEFPTAAGPKKVWTTFSSDQADINLADPRMLLRLLEVLFYYVRQGAGYVRLDAIAFLWKVPGTRCIHLEQTHRIIQLMRAALEEFAPGVQLITETNVPHTDNISYFGNGTNEAHLVYNFALPPLVFHTLRTGDSRALQRWAGPLELPSDQTTFFNFLASHDGIGLNPARGILSPDEINALVATVLAHGGYVSYKNNPDGTQSPYEMNISYFDALSDPQGTDPLPLQVARFLAAHAILFALRGLPAVYFHSFFGSRGDRSGAETSGISRRINRKKLTLRELEEDLRDPENIRHRVHAGLDALLTARASQDAFSPFAGQNIPETPKELFVIERFGPDGSRILAIVNVTNREQAYTCPDGPWKPLLGAECRKDAETLLLPPYGVCWLAD